MISRSINGQFPSEHLRVPLRLALALAFLFRPADRLGIPGPPGTAGVAWADFKNPLRYSAQVDSLAPEVPEIRFGIALLPGLCTALAAAGGGALLLLSGGSMAISFGIRSPFDYPVFSAMGGALLLAAWNAYPLSADSLLRSISSRPHVLVRPGSRSRNQRSSSGEATCKPSAKR